MDILWLSIIFDLIKVNKMLSRICNRTKYALFNRTSHYFSNDKKQSHQLQKKASKPTISNRFEAAISKYINRLQNLAQNKAKDNGFNYSNLYQRFSSKFNNNANDNNNSQEQQKKSGQLGLISFLIAAALIAFSNKQQDQSGVTSKASKVLNQAQMLEQLASGKFNLDLIIMRQMVSTGENPIYQNVCLAKEANKTDHPVICIITNLPLFLTNLENIKNIQYRVSFNYAAEILPEGRSIGIGNIIFWGLVIYILYKVRNGLNPANMGLGDLVSKKFQPINPENIKTLFKDVAGMHEAKQQITEFVDFLKKPDRYIEMGAKIPKGAILTGPPGTGKTLLARACAGQAGVPFFYVSGSEFVQKYVGMGANRVRNLFESASKAAPSIIFIDQIDAIGKKRNSGPFSNEQKQNTLNQLLVNMDGFDSKQKVIVMAATNIKQSLDPALLRPGRFDRSVEISLPSFQERSQILQVHLAKVKFNSSFTIQELAKKISILTPGFSGAELANICNEAAILAAREGKDSIELPEFQKATQRVMAGLEKRNLFSDQEKQCLAYYQCGKAVASWFTQGADPVIKISITPYSKSSKGYSHELKNEMPLKTEAELINKVICYLAGRTTEKILKGYTTSNGDEDMKKAKRIISFLVVKFGMSKIGKIGFPDIEYVRKPYSDQTERKIDREIERIYRECQQKTQKLVNQRRQFIQKLKVLILQKQTLSHNTLKEVLGERPFANNQNYQKFLKDNQSQAQSTASQTQKAQ